MLVLDQRFDAGEDEVEQPNPLRCWQGGLAQQGELFEQAVDMRVVEYFWRASEPLQDVVNAGIIGGAGEGA